MEVRRLDMKKDKESVMDYILNKHYASRKPSISYAYGLFTEGRMCGLLTVGKPASNALCVGVCGKAYSSQVYELNRLIVDEGISFLYPNALSRFVSTVLKLLKQHNLIIISYADSGMNHNGYIYQATNFIYTGATKARTDKYSPGGKHSRHSDDTYSHLRKVRTSKHRYIYFAMHKLVKKKAMKSLNYAIQPYPKGDNERYVLGETIKTKIINKKDGTVFYE